MRGINTEQQILKKTIVTSEEWHIQDDGTGAIRITLNNGQYLDIDKKMLRDLTNAAAEYLHTTQGDSYQ